jgi:hypothetical protein
MNLHIIKRIMLAALPLMLLTLTSCSDDDNSSSLDAVTNISYTPTMGGAVINFTAPSSNELLYIKAVYTNSLGKTVYNVTSIFSNEIEIEGLSDESKTYPVSLYAVDKQGGESPVAVIDVKPNRSYINTINDSLRIDPIVGGIEVSWINPAGADTVTAENPGKTVYVNIHYTDPQGKEISRYLSSQAQHANVKLRGLDPGEYTFSYQVEDFQGNKTALSSPLTRTVREEVIIPKYTEDANGYRTYLWTLVSGQTTLKEVNENRNAAIFDGVVDDKDNAGDNSYAGTSGSKYGGAGTMPWGTDQLDIVVDMHQTVNISRIRAWQRAHLWGWSPYAQDWRTDGTSYDYDYYQPDNLREFALYGSMDAQNWFLIQNCDIATNSTGGKLPVTGARDDKWNGHAITASTGMPTQESYNYAIAGHLWELDKMSEQTRYIRVRFLQNWDMSKRSVTGLSELTLYGAVISDNVSSAKARSMKSNKK